MERDESLEQSPFLSTPRENLFSMSSESLLLFQWLYFHDITGTMCHILCQKGSLKKQQDENVIIRSSHQTDMVIKSEDIKEILWDDFALIHCGLKNVP